MSGMHEPMEPAYALIQAGILLGGAFFGLGTRSLPAVSRVTDSGLQTQINVGQNTRTHA